MPKLLSDHGIQELLLTRLLQFLLPDQVTASLWINSNLLYLDLLPNFAASLPRRDTNVQLSLLIITANYPIFICKHPHQVKKLFKPNEPLKHLPRPTVLPFNIIMQTMDDLLNQSFNNTVRLTIKPSLPQVSMHISKMLLLKRELETFKTQLAQCSFMPSIDGPKQSTIISGLMLYDSQMKYICILLSNKLERHP